MGCFSSPREHLPRRARRSVFSCCRARRILFIALLSSLDHRTTPGTSDPRNVSWLPSTDLIQTIVDQTDADRLAFVAVIANVAAHFDWGVDPLPGTHPPAFWWHYFSSVSALHDPRTGVLPTCWTAATKAKVAGQPGSVNRFNAYRNFLAAVKGSSCSSTCSNPQEPISGHQLAETLPCTQCVVRHRPVVLDAIETMDAHHNDDRDEDIELTNVKRLPLSSWFMTGARGGLSGLRESTVSSATLNIRTGNDAM